MNRRVLVLSLLCASTAGSCTLVPEPPPLASTQGSPEMLASVVLDALATRDRGTLEALALNEQEFHDHVWPELPAARPERNLPFSYVWGDLRQKSEQALAQTLNEHGGRRLELLSVRAAGETTDYRTYRVHRETLVVVRDPAGTPQELRLFGSMLEKNGTWKVFSYVND